MPEVEHLVTENGTLERVFRHKRVIGSGSFGLVMKATHCLDGAEYAIKFIPFHESKRDQVMREVQSLSRLSTHNNIVSYKGCWIEDVDQVRRQKLCEFIQTISGRRERPDFILCIKMECCSTNLRDYLISRNKKFFSEDQYLSQEPCLRDGRYFPAKKHQTNKSIFQDVVRGLDFLHKRKIIHRDLKPGNILLDADTKDFKITDFGLAKLVPETPATLTNAGTEMYAAPEQMRHKRYGMPADVYPLGLILLELVFPVHGVGPETPLDAGSASQNCLLKEAHEKKIPIGVRVMHPIIADLICEMLHEKPESRPLVSQILAVNWDSL